MDSKRTTIIAACGIAAATAIVLKLMGQPWWCSCGSWAPWTSDAWSHHNSQHFLDPYSFTHFSHGLAFFWVLALIFKTWSAERRFVITVGLEAIWELIENSPWVIEHYRKNTAAFDYFGDSVLNSLGDLVCCCLGFLFAASVPWWGTLAIFGVFEIGLLLTIRDNLILNIINLTGNHPSLVEWQSQAK